MLKSILGAAATGAFALGAVAIAGETAKTSVEALLNWEGKIEKMFAAADTDGDARVTEAEFVEYHAAKARAQFAEIAAGQDHVTLDAVKAHFAALEAQKAPIAGEGE
jgi:hypothetical protein